MSGYVYLKWIVLSMAIGKLAITTVYDDMINRISLEHGNNPHLVKALIRQESNFNPNAKNFSRIEESRGLGQINRPTAVALGVQELDRLFDPEYNILIMNKLLTDIKYRFDTITDIIATYNAGRVRKKKDGTYRNNTYVLNVYARFLLYSYINIIPDIFQPPTHA